MASQITVSGLLISGGGHPPFRGPGEVAGQCERYVSAQSTGRGAAIDRKLSGCYERGRVDYSTSASSISRQSPVCQGVSSRAILAEVLNDGQDGGHVDGSAAIQVEQQVVSRIGRMLAEVLNDGQDVGHANQIVAGH